MRKIFVAFLMFLATASMFAQSLPRMKDAYVTDAADILSRSELKQLRTDVKSMCDYYSTRIVVGIVSTFGDYDIDEYAGELAGKWDLSDENTMLILVKPKSDEERGEALLLASSDLKDVFTNDVCDEIVQEQMIPHFKQDDYFGGIEAALEYMNNMSDEEGAQEAVAVTPSENEQKSSSKFMEFLSDVGVGAVTIVKWGLIALVALALIGAVAWLIIRKKEEKEDREEHTSPKPSNFSSRNDSEEISTAIADKRQEIEKRKRDIEELNRLEKESRDLDDEYDAMRERSERNERTRQRDYDDYDDRDYDDYDDRDDYEERKSTSDLEDMLEKMSRSQESTGKGRKILGTVGKVAAGVAGAAVVGKIVKNRREKDGDDDEGGLLSDIGSVFKKKNKAGKTASGKPKLGGSGKPKSNSSGSKPKLGGGGGSKPKLGGNSSSGGW